MSGLRVGLISDVHADLEALNMALDLLAERGADKVVCLGDLVEKGDDGDAVVSAVEAGWIPCVKGNHDENAVVHATMDPAFLPEGYVERPLQAETLAFLDELPRERRYQWEGEELLLVHATPSSLRASLFHTDGNKSFSKRFKKDLLRCGADAILLGHTHIPMQASYKGVRIFNPGAVCRRKPRDSHTCAILTLPSYAFEVFAIETGEVTDAVLRLEG